MSGIFPNQVTCDLFGDLDNEDPYSVIGEKKDDLDMSIFSSVTSLPASSITAFPMSSSSMPASSITTFPVSSSSMPASSSMIDYSYIKFFNGKIIKEKSITPIEMFIKQNTGEIFDHMNGKDASTMRIVDALFVPNMQHRENLITAVMHRFMYNQKYCTIETVIFNRNDVIMIDIPEHGEGQRRKLVYSGRNVRPLWNIFCFGFVNTFIKKLYNYDEKKSEALAYVMMSMLKVSSNDGYEISFSV